MATTCTINISSDIAPGFGGISESMTASKIYIRNIGDGKGNIDKSVGVTIGVNAEPVGKLFGGDWMMMPLTCIDADDVTATPATDDIVVLEFVMFYEEA